MFSDHPTGVLFHLFAEPIFTIIYLMCQKSIEGLQKKRGFINNHLQCSNNCMWNDNYINCVGSLVIVRHLLSIKWYKKQQPKSAHVVIHLKMRRPSEDSRIHSTFVMDASFRSYVILSRYRHIFRVVGSRDLKFGVVEKYQTI